MINLTRITGIMPMTVCEPHSYPLRKELAVTLRRLITRGDNAW